MSFFGTDPATLKFNDQGFSSFELTIEDTQFVVLVSKRVRNEQNPTDHSSGQPGSKAVKKVPVPLGCSAISVPVDIHADESWFAGMFEGPRPITQLSPQLLFTCVACFLPHLRSEGLIIPSIDLTCFWVTETGKYQLYVPKCKLIRTSDSKQVSDFNDALVALLPGNGRYKHALECVKNLEQLPKHPAGWTLDDDVNFLTVLITEYAYEEFPSLKRILKNGDWGSNPTIKADAEGTSWFWREQERKRKTVSRHVVTKIEDLTRYMRNKIIHFNQLPARLKNIFNNSKQGVLDYCNSLVDGGI